jgi:hypothetical protein
MSSIADTLGPLRAPLRLAAVTVLSFLVGGCVNATIEQFREGEASITDGERVVVLGRRQNNGYETETNFVDCVSRSLGRRIAVLPEQEFVDELFPWFEPRTAPLKTDDLPALLANPLVAGQIEQAGVRYLIWVDGVTNTTDSAGSMTCTISPGGGGCFGFVTWARDSSYEASIWDLKTGNSVGRISSDASGTSYMPAMIVPLPIIARVQAQACGGLAEQLSSFLTAES